jgi:hypothetical protein
VYIKNEAGEDVQLNPLWNRRQSTKFNGVSYPVQRAAQAIYTEEGKKEIQENLDYYMTNAKVIRESLEKLGLEVYGGVDSPYIWFKTPSNIDSWSFFDILLDQAHVVSTPGAGFGPSGEGYIRLTAFNTYEKTVEAMERMDDPNYKPTEEDMRKVYRAWNYIIPSDGAGDARMAKDVAKQRAKFFNELSNRGYSAVLDTNDAIYGGFKAEAPVIMFDPTAVAMTDASRVTTQDKVYSDVANFGHQAMRGWGMLS